MITIPQINTNLYSVPRIILFRRICQLELKLSMKTILSTTDRLQQHHENHSVCYRQTTTTPWKPFCLLQTYYNNTMKTILSTTDRLQQHHENHSVYYRQTTTTPWKPFCLLQTDYNNTMKTILSTTDRLQQHHENHSVYYRQTTTTL
jgi:ribosomal protein S12